MSDPFASFRLPGRTALTPRRPPRNRSLHRPGPRRRGRASRDPSCWHGRGSQPMPLRSSGKSRPQVERLPRSVRISPLMTPATFWPLPSPHGRLIHIWRGTRRLNCRRIFERSPANTLIARSPSTGCKLPQIQPCNSLAFPHGRTRLSWVVTIGSLPQQERPHPAMFVYAGTKAAQLNWTLSPARQFGGQGVTVNNLAPGAILTARNRDQMAIEAEALTQTHPGRSPWPARRSGRRGDAAVFRRWRLHQWGQSVRRWRAGGCVTISPESSPHRFPDILHQGPSRGAGTPRFR